MRCSAVPRKTQCYRLQGLLSNTGELLAGVKDGPAYLSSVQHLGDRRGPGPIRRDFSLKRGAWARGRDTDQSTGQPVKDAITRAGETRDLGDSKWVD
jgi:hypothetical protein